MKTRFSGILHLVHQTNKYEQAEKIKERTCIKGAACGSFDQTRLLWVEWRCCSLSLFLFNRWHYLWKQDFEHILGEKVVSNPV